MKKMNNKVFLEGRLYQHDLKLKVTGENSKHPGTQYISGSIELATDDNITNTISVRYTYVTPTFGNGKPNGNFTILNDILNDKYPTCLKDGADVATKLRITSAIGLNEFYSENNVPEGQDLAFVSGKINDGGFITIINALNSDEGERNKFDVDIVITKFTVKEADEERGYPEKGIIKGAIFDFRNALLPVSFSVTNPDAIRYFEGLEVSATSPIFTRIKGNEINEVIKRTITVEGAFGDEVREVENSRRDWVVNFAYREPYEYGSEDVLTAEELTAAMSDRETYLANLKGSYLERKKNNGNAISSSTAAPKATNKENTPSFEF